MADHVLNYWIFECILTLIYIHVLSNDGKNSPTNDLFTHYLYVFDTVKRNAENSNPKPDAEKKRGSLPWFVCSLTLDRARSFCVLRLTCSKGPLLQKQWTHPLPPTRACTREKSCLSHDSPLFLVHRRRRAAIGPHEWRTHQHAWIHIRPRHQAQIEKKSTKWDFFC